MLGNLCWSWVLSAWHASWLSHTADILDSPFTEMSRETAVREHSHWKCMSTRGFPCLHAFLPPAYTRGFCCLECQKPREGSKHSSWRRQPWDLRGMCGTRPSLCEILAPLVREYARVGRVGMWEVTGPLMTGPVIKKDPKTTSCLFIWILSIWYVLLKKNMVL